MNPGMSLQQKLDTIFIKYRLSKTGIIQRIELPALPGKGGITIDISTVDYMGHYKGHPVAFDAKESKIDRVNFKSTFKVHQVQFLTYWKASALPNKVFSGFVLHFYTIDKDNLYFLDIDVLNKMINDGEKSVYYKDIPTTYPFNDMFLETYFN